MMGPWGFPVLFERRRRYGSSKNMFVLLIPIICVVLFLRIMFVFFF